MRETLKTNISKYGPKINSSITVENIKGSGLHLVVIYAGKKHYLPLSSVPLSPDRHANHPNHQKIKVNHDGRVGIGTTPDGQLHVKNSVNGTEAAPQLKITGGVSNYSCHVFLDATACYIGQNSSIRDLRMYNTVESAGVALDTSGDTAWGTFSDERVKRDITEITGGLGKLKDVRCVNYRFIDDPDDRPIRIGVIAQDLVGKVDEALSLGAGWGSVKEDDNEYYSVRYTELIPPLIKAVQELSEKVTALENKGV